MNARFRRLLILGVALSVAAALPAQTPAAVPRYTRPGQGQIFYMVMTDRFANGDSANDTGGLGSDRTVSGLDPTSTGFYHGGDLKGLRQRLDYIAGLGATSLWITPPFRNQPVQGPVGSQSAAYHGYWITDFLNVDPHLGTNADLAGLVTDAHALGLRVYLDIVVNHTADVIQYQSGQYTYISKSASPYHTSGGATFDDRTYAYNGLGDANSFPTLSAAISFPRVPVVAAAAANLKNPAFLNDLANYHNRGDSTFSGENSAYGDFFGLDDVFTEKPVVVNGFIDIYRSWMTDYNIDGFRIDTMKHVNAEFWQDFGPAVRAQAVADGRADFFHFGEVADSDATNVSEYATWAGADATLDFGFQGAARQWVSQAGDAANLASFFDQDDYYIGPTSNAYLLPTFLGNHDMGRFGYFLKLDNASASAATVLSLDELGHALLYLARGQPIVYYGDEQGLAGNGGDQAARQDMFGSQTPSYQAEQLIGTSRTGASDKFDPSHPLYALLASLAQLRQANPALENGAMIVRSSGSSSVFAFSRIDRAEQVEYLVLLNNSRASTATATVQTSQPAGAMFNRIFSLGPVSAIFATDPLGRVSLVLPPLGCAVLQAAATLPGITAAPNIAWTMPAANSAVSLASRSIDGHVWPGRVALQAALDTNTFAEVTFAYVRSSRPNDTEIIGTDDNAPYRVYWHPPADISASETVTFVATVNDLRGHVASATLPGIHVTLSGTTPSFAPQPVAPAITVQPTGHAVAPGATVSLQVTASGTGPLFYRWAKDGNLLSGAGDWADTLTLTNVSAADAGSYVCYVTNLAGMVATNTASLTVNSVQVLNSIAYNSATFPVSATPGATVSFTCNVTNTGTNTWGANHFLVLRDASLIQSDPSHANLDFAALGGVGPGASATVSLQFSAPATGGDHTYYVQALENNVAWFSTWMTLHLAVTPAPAAGLAADFNGDGRADLLWSNTGSGDRYLWLMNAGSVLSSVFLGTVAPPWMAAAGDFDGDGKTDLLWSNATSGDRYLWLMNGGTVTASIYVGTFAPSWAVAIGDFNGDGRADLLWSNTSNGDRYVWLMNGGTVTASVFLGTIAPSWTATIGDFNGDGKADILWSNANGGDRYLWLMNGGTISTNVFLGTIAPSWAVAIGDFNGDGRADLLWSNASSGDRYLWLMNGGVVTADIFLGTVSAQWAATAADFNGDGKADILWSNASTGDRYLWLMSGGTVASSIYLGNVAPIWQVGP